MEREKEIIVQQVNTFCQRFDKLQNAAKENDSIDIRSIKKLELHGEYDQWMRMSGNDIDCKKQVQKCPSNCWLLLVVFVNQFICMIYY